MTTEGRYLALYGRLRISKLFNLNVLHHHCFRLNGSIFGAIDRAGNAHDLDDDDEYEHIINKRQRSRSESSSTSQGTDDADESNVDESNNSNIKTRQRRKTPKTE